MKAFNKLDFYLIASASPGLIKQFSAAHGLQRFSNFIFVRDTARSLLSYFNAPGVPYLAFYDNKKKLKEVSIGKNDISKLIDIVTNK